MGFDAVIAHGLEVHGIDKTLTISSVFFIAFVFGGAGVVWAVLHRTMKNPWRHFGVMAAGVLVFELFTAPMWHNEHLGALGYIYDDVSWILLIGWSALLLGVIAVVDRYCASHRALIRFFWYLAITLVLVVPFEAFLVSIGVRSYSPEVMEAINGSYLPLLNVPSQSIFYVPIFGGLIIAFYKYWMFFVLRTPIVPLKSEKLGRNFILALVAVLLFELMIEPMVINQGFPEWSYVYRDVSLILTGVWILIIWAATSFVDTFFKFLSMGMRFVMYVFVGMVLAWPFESYLIAKGYRVYGESASANFTGITTPLTGAPVEVFFAIPFYLTLMICFVRYWRIVFDNKL